jgi:lysophospholipase L1-like esterase
MSKHIVICLLTFLSFASSAKTSDSRMIIEAYGGSSTAGVMAIRKNNGRLTNIITKDNEMHFLNGFLQKKYGQSIKVINKGQPSAQAIELLNGTYKYKENGLWADEMKKSKARLIILNFATNDARHYHFKDAKPGYVLSPEQYEKVMTELITIARDNGKQVVLQEPHPLCGKAEKWDVSPYSSKLDSLAKSLSVPVVKQYQRIQDMAGWPSMMSPDCIHPSNELYKIKAEETYKVIEDNFETLMARH